jgi:DNA polymerase III subunit chi
MTSCTFHDTTPATHERKLFEIVERAYNLKQKVLVYVQDEARAVAMDRTLWILKQEAFIPHKVVGKGETDSSLAVAIVTSETNPNLAEVLVADGHCSLDFAGAFQFVNEFVNRSSVEMHQACRERFKSYRQKQIPVEYMQS